MVRFKNRYVLLEVCPSEEAISPESITQDQFHHVTLDIFLTFRNNHPVLQAVKDAIIECHGDLGAAKIAFSLQSNAQLPALVL